MRLIKQIKEKKRVYRKANSIVGNFVCLFYTDSAKNNAVRK